jgi:hypothetical protein
MRNEYIVSVTYFDDEIEDIISFGKVEDVPLLSRENYQPDAATALLDAIGKSIDTIQEKFEAEINEDLASVVVVILTDGFENASIKYTYEQIAAKIERLNATKKWIFTFLGAGINAETITDRINIRPENVVSFNRTEYSAMLDKVSLSVRNYEEKKIAGIIDNNIF